MLNRPGRPFGISLAILTAIILYGFIPILIGVSLLYLKDFVHIEEDNAISGILVTNFSSTPLLMMIGVGLFFIVVAIWCWRGRPPLTRFVFQAMVVVYTLLLSLSLLQTSRQFPAPVTSADMTQNSANQIYLVACLLLLLYVLWFMNRWSARAFYRGYYTEYDLQLLEDAQLTS